MFRFHEEDAPSRPLASTEGDPFGYDPLTDPWPAPQAIRAAEDFDEAFGFQALPAAAEEPTLDFTRYDGYPSRRVAPYYERLTELQRRLREETVVVQTPERRWGVTLRELAETLILAALIFLAVRASFQNFRVEGQSMQPSLDNGEYLIVNKLSYAQIDLGALDWLPFFDAGDNPLRNLWGEPERGDVVVFRSPTSVDRDFIKRIIGLPGDTVEISQSTNEVFVNGVKLDEPYVEGATSCGESCTYVIPESGSAAAHAECGSDDCYFVMGDNRQNSSDSRGGWLVPKENIIGKALVTYWHNGAPNIGLAPNHGDPAAASD